MRVLALSSILISTFATCAYADSIPPCAPPLMTSAVGLPGGLAPAVQQALKESVGDIILPGQDFDATDVISIGKNRRFIFAWNSGSKWLIATEHGGRGYNIPIFLYNLSGDGKTASLVETRVAFPTTVCSIATSLISG